MDNDDYDTTIDKNRGYRYENVEMVDYFPTWPNCGPNHTYNLQGPGCAQVDCSNSKNFCSNCCDGRLRTDTTLHETLGSHYHKPGQETVFLPPGIIPLRCLPGQFIPLPFAGFLSPPHFAWSPSDVTSTMYGLNPDPNGKHHPGAFDIQPVRVSCSTVQCYSDCWFNCRRRFPDAAIGSFLPRSELYSVSSNQEQLSPLFLAQCPRRNGRLCSQLCKVNYKNTPIDHSWCRNR